MSALRQVLRLIMLGRRDGLRARVRRRVGFGWVDGCAQADEDAGVAGPQATAERAPSKTTLSAPPGHDGVLASDALPEGGLVEVFANGKAVALARVDGTVFATSNVCPHAGGPIGDGSLEGHTVTCPYHGWSFDVRDGRCFVNAEVMLDTITAIESDGVICVARS